MGKSGGSGKYSYNQESRGPYSVMVSLMPEDTWSVRIKFSHLGETGALVKITDMEAELLWKCLNRTAKDLGWSEELEG